MRSLAIPTPFRGPLHTTWGLKPRVRSPGRSVRVVVGTLLAYRATTWKDSREPPELAAIEAGVKIIRSHSLSEELGQSFTTPARSS